MRRNLSHLATGSVFSQAILVIVMPFLTRIYNPDAFGALAVFSATYAFTIPFATLKYDSTLILPKSNQSATHITVMVTLLVSVLMVLVGAVLGIMLLLGKEEPSWMLWLPVALWLGAIYTLTQQWSARRSNYRDFAHSQMVGALLNTSTSLILGLWLGGRPIFLVLAFIVGLGGSLSYMCWGKYRQFFLFSRVRYANLLRRAIAYRQFPILVLPSTLLTVASQSSVPLILALYYSISEIGQFAIASRILLLPVAVIGGALVEAFRAEFVRRRRSRQKILGLVVTTLRTLLIIAPPVFGGLALVAPYAFSFVFGTDYQEAGNITRALALGVGLQFIGTPFSVIFVALRRSAIGLKMQIVTTLLPLSVLFFSAAANFKLSAALALFSVASAISIIIMIFIAYRFCKMTDGELFSVGGG
jgi:O-antigen/teichoic acid export membrane protein